MMAHKMYAQTLLEKLEEKNVEKIPEHYQASFIN